MAADTDTPRALHEILDGTAHRIASRGTHSEALVLEALAAAARNLCPGAAAALVDWEGPEIARLRAFGIVHGALLGDLGSVSSAASGQAGLADLAWVGRRDTPLSDQDVGEDGPFGHPSNERRERRPHRRHRRLAPAVDPGPSVPVT
jgi:hypothetical protein